ncbi:MULTISPECIES: fimbrial protein [unclassified Serratia (in: enterobacteria)]|uniref:fimbrial protein n=1 Tax=unclassified Serratia (in: enterobacteria) TaxID=2647522 RepID=UPI00068CB132|nr:MULTISPECIES: fimbrial protein [unclassified Serratia (in: enterobacteria)]
MHIVSTLRNLSLLALVCYGAGVQASSTGVLNVTGSIKLATCYFDSVPGQEQKTYDWVLPQVFMGNLNSPGMTHGRAQGSIHIGGARCTNGYTPYITLNNGATVSANTGNLINTLSNEAENVEIRLLMKDTPLDLRTSPRVDCAVIVNNQSQCDIEYEYYATGLATPGKVKSAVQFNISYD